MYCDTVILVLNYLPLNSAPLSATAMHTTSTDAMNKVSTLHLTLGNILDGDFSRWFGSEKDFLTNAVMAGVMAGCQRSTRSTTRG